MSQITENGILDNAAFESFKARSWSLKFMQAILQGVGGATIFGVVATAMTAVLGAAAGTPILTALGGAAGLWAIGGLMTFAVACIGLGTKFMFESQILDQDFQAKKIAAATALGHNVAVKQHEPVKTHSTPPGMSEHLEARPHESKWADRVGHANEQSPHEHSIPKPHVDSWAENVRKSEQHDEHQPSHSVH